MSATDTNKFAPLNAECLAQRKFDYCADSVEFVPSSTLDARTFVSGNYQLRDGARIGRTILSSFSADGQIIDHQSLNGPAVLDLKWAVGLVAQRHLLAQANADGSVCVLGMHSQTSRPEGAAPSLETLVASSPHDRNVIALSIDWCSTEATGGGVSRITNASSVPPRVASSFSDGMVRVFEFRDATLMPLHEWRAHELETWIVAADKWQPHVIYTGADDAVLKVWDVRAPPSMPSLVNASHRAGVCALHSSPHHEHTLATGSYDERLRLFDTRNCKVPLSSVPLGGGVWRVKFHPHAAHATLVIAACMHNGFHVIDTAPTSADAPTVCASYGEHDSIAYGVDWCHAADERFLIASCSFYDCAQHVWRMSRV